MTAITPSASPEPARQRPRPRRVMVFLAVWTVLVFLALWWLIRFAGDQGNAASWIFHAGDTGRESFAERARDWFRLVHLNFQRVYPWVLLGPYVAWLGARFALERGRLRLNLPVHLAACGLFILASHTINERASSRVARVVIITSQTNIDAQPGTNRVHIEMSRSASDQLAREEFTRFTAQNPRGVPPDMLYLHPGKSVGLTNLLPDLGTDFKGPHFPPDLPTMRPLSILLDLFAYGAIAGMAHSVHFYRRYRERERRALSLEATLVQARLSALQTQLQPHFLFNSLNAIVTLLRRDPRLAEATLMSLSDLLRLTLSQSEKQEVTLREELQFAHSYREIQQTRFGDRLRFEEEIEPAALDCLVPTLLLQPLIENAIRHGIEPAEQAGLVRLMAQEKQGRLALAVEDDGVGLKGKDALRVETANGEPGARQGTGQGIGLSNLRARLQALYGANQSLEVLERTGGGVSVRIEIPWRTANSTTPETAERCE